MIIGQPFSVAGVVGEFDVKATVRGGGCRDRQVLQNMEFLRALALYEPSLRVALKAFAGFLTRDARVVERKKYGKPKAHAMKFSVF